METRERLLETAARLFHEQGYAATGVATILREADANSGSLYHFFPNKDALLAGVLEWYRDHLEDDRAATGGGGRAGSGGADLPAAGLVPRRHDADAAAAWGAPSATWRWR